MLEKMIKGDRARESKSAHPKQSLLLLSQSDRGRVVYSSAFRRLQQKAQVFSLESNSAVRSRLTHSLEVSHIGRFLVSSILEKIRDKDFSIKDAEFWITENLAISNFVETSCLMHDIGNPPFGHFGESAIKSWFNSESCKDAITASLGELAGEKVDLSDFENFDGNPQGLRIVTKLQGDDGETGLNLTYTQITSFMKYVVPFKELDNNHAFKKKLGYFSSEEELIENAYAALELKKFHRHPLVFLMEAADDISYCISDIEDGIEKKIIKADDFINFVEERTKVLYSAHPTSDFIRKFKDNFEKVLNKEDAEIISPFLRFRTNLANFLVDESAKVFLQDYDKIFDFERDQPLIAEKSPMFDVLEILRDFTKKEIFASYEAETIELSGYSIISGILDVYSRLLKLNRANFSLIVKGEDKKKHGLDIESRLYRRLPEKYRASYVNYTEGQDDVTEWNLRAHLIVDYISGMTDQFSLEIYHMLKGISIK